MQIPVHVENKLKQLEFDRRIAMQERDEARRDVYIYMLVAIIGWTGFIMMGISELAQGGV